MSAVLRKLFRPARRQPRRDRARLGLERLDRRDLPSATANLVSATGALTITGSDQADQVVVSELPSTYNPLLILGGVSSVTLDGHPISNAIPTTMVRSLNVNLGGGDDSFAINRSPIAFDINNHVVANPWYNVLQSMTVHGGGGNDKIDLSASNFAPASVYGESGNDTLIGGAGNDTLVGGGDADLMYGNGGNDVLYGAETVGHGYTDGANTMYGGPGDDRLYGGDGGNVEYGEAGNDALYGGYGSGVSILWGGAGADRFLVRDERYNANFLYGLDKVFDRAAEDAVVHLASSWDFVGFVPVTQHSWSDSEIENVLDPALGKLVARTNNTRLLKLSNGGELTFERHGSLGTIGGTSLTVAGDNNSQGLIRIADPTFSSGDDAAKTVVIHELGHNWDDPSENAVVSQFRSLSGWTPYPLWLIGQLPGYTVSGDGQWQYNSSRSGDFLRTYSQRNPFEDFADSFEATIDGTAGSIADKANLINSWLDSIKS